MINENYQKLMALKMIRGWVGHCMRCVCIVLKDKSLPIGYCSPGKK